jgi:hypothetical protein
MLATDTPKGKMIDKKLKYTIDNLFPTLKNASKLVEGDLSPMTGIKTYDVDIEQQKSFAIQAYIKKLQEAEANAKKEGELAKTAEQIKTAKENEEQYQKIKDIYEKEYQKRQAIYNNNYVIKKKK